MTIPIENSVIAPDSIYTPQIVLQMVVVNGKLRTSAQITLAAAKCENAGTDQETWTPTGQMQTVYISDVMNLDADLTSLQEQVGQVYGELIALIAAINSIRKVL